CLPVLFAAPEAVESPLMAFAAEQPRLSWSLRRNGSLPPPRPPRRGRSMTSGGAPDEFGVLLDRDHGAHPDPAGTTMHIAVIGVRARGVECPLELVRPAQQAA